MENNNIFIFDEKATNNFIEIEINDDIGWVNNHHVDTDNCKMFMLLLKSALNNIKLKGVTIFQQCVLQEDWDDFLSENKEWNIIEKYENTLLIACDIDLAHELIIDGFLRNNKTY
jgi:hypothetical protein